MDCCDCNIYFVYYLGFTNSESTTVISAQLSGNIEQQVIPNLSLDYLRRKWFRYHRSPNLCFVFLVLIFVQAFIGFVTNYPTQKTSSIPIIMVLTPLLTDKIRTVSSTIAFIYIHLSCIALVFHLSSIYPPFFV